MVELVSGVKRMALNLENENVRIVIFGNNTTIKERDIVKCIGSIVDVHVGKTLIGHVVDTLGIPIDGKGVVSTAKQRCVKVEAPRIIACKSMHKPMQTGLKVVDSLVLIGCGQ
jgi:F0F1-type ATP synthase alpha subunit